MEYIIENLNNSTEEYVYMLMGSKAQELDGYISPLKDYVFQCEHPARASYLNRPMQHDHIFSVTNKVLASRKKEPIKWLKQVKNEVEQTV
jgi:uracil DNA glycosylase